MNPQLPQRLAERLRAPLPGAAVQARFQPELSCGRHFGPAPAHARPAAVLVLLYPLADEWHLPLTLRPPHMIDHAGQISLPGGGIEAQERSSAAALRELEEELGVAATGVELVGQLSPIYLFRTNFQITPWVAATRVRPVWFPSAAEVAAVIELPLASLLDPAVSQVKMRRQGQVEFAAPSFCWQEHAVWGATAMILAELAALAQEVGS